MKSVAAAISFLASALAVSGQPVQSLAVSADPVQSRPFNLQLISANTGVNGEYIGSCHSGPSIQNLCLADSPVTMHLNSTIGQNPDNGLLIWPLSDSNLSIGSAMRLIVEPSTNVAQAFFFPGLGNGQYVRFVNDELFIVSSVDDTKQPIEIGLANPIANWYICNIYYTGYHYRSLSWVYGKASPQNPTCVKVSVRRNFE